MSHILMKFEADYADEFTVYGMKIVTVEEYDDLVIMIKLNKPTDISWSFGTNEFIDGTLGSLWSNVSITYITLEVKDYLESVMNFQCGTYGNIPDFQYLIEELDYE